MRRTVWGPMAAGTTLALLTAGTAQAQMESGVFRGIYRMGLDKSAFRPCGSDAYWWLTAATEDARAFFIEGDMTQGYLEVAGRRTTLAEPMRRSSGSYKHHLYVTEVRDSARAGEEAYEACRNEGFDNSE